MFAATLLFLCGCRANQPIPQPPQAVQIQTVESVTPGQVTQTRFSAVVLPDSQVPLAFRIPGYVTSLLEVKGGDGKLREVAEGDYVAKGAVLARLRPLEYEDKVRQAASQVQAARAAAEKAKGDFERASRLFDSQSITKPEYEAARAQYDATQAQLRAANALRAEADVALGDTKLSAPLSGDVVKKAVEVGSLVGPGTLAFVVADTDVVKVVIGVPDVTLRLVKVGTPVTVTLEALPRRVVSARITRVTSAADPKTRNFEVETAIPNPDHAMKAGMIASVELPWPAAQAALVRVPLSAIVQSVDGGYGVFTVDTGNGGSVAHFCPIEVGEVYGNEIAVARGITPGDRIVTVGASILKDGERVEVLK
jgi:multidrug efflux system membrane fusion protein